MSNKEKKLKPLLHQNHRRPVTRRELLSQGFLMGGGYIAMPGILSILSEKVYASGCDNQGADQVMTPMIILDLAGGANIPGSNVMVGGAGGQSDLLGPNAYVPLGLPTDMHPAKANQLNTDLGLHFHADSAFLRGIFDTTTNVTRSNVDGAVFCNASGDDTANNPHNPSYWIVQAGARGKLVRQVASRASESGGNSRSPRDSINPTISPVAIRNSGDVLKLVDPGKLATLLSVSDAEKVLKLAGNLSQRQLAKFQNLGVPSQVAELINCGYLGSSSIISEFSAETLDPRNDDDVRDVFSGNFGVGASIAKLVLDGFAGTGTIEINGCDYHGNNRSTGEGRDLSVGRTIGRILELAARKNTDCMLYVFTDGGITTNGEIDESSGGRGKCIWTADSGQRSASFSLLYKKDGRIKIRNNRRQVGNFNPGGGVDSASSLVGRSVSNLAKAVVANYLSLHGMEGRLAEIVGDNPFENDMDKYLVYEKLR